MSDTEYEELKEAAITVIRFIRDYMTLGGFVGRYRIEEFVKLAELVGEPLESEELNK